MNHITRRRLLRTASVVPVAAALAACGALTPSPTPSPTPTPTPSSAPAWVTGIDDVGAMVSTGIAELQGFGLGGAALSTAQSIVAGIEQAAGAVGALSTPAAGSSALATIESYVNQLAPVVAPFVSLIPG